MSLRTCTVALDAHSLIYRSFYASQASPDAPEACEVLARLVGRIVRDLEPDYVIAAADTAGPLFRHAISSDYKASRKTGTPELLEQIPLALGVLTNAGIPVHTCPTFEADDLLATLAARIRPGHRLVVVSSDRDLAAVVDDQVDLYLVKSGGRHKLFTAADAHEIFGVAPARIAEYKALVGDKSDNILGVPGVGDKGALQLLGMCDSLDAIVRAGATLGRPGKLAREHQVAMREAYHLTRLRTDVPLELDVAAARWNPTKGVRLRDAGAREEVPAHG